MPPILIVLHLVPGAGVGGGGGGGDRDERAERGGRWERTERPNGPPPTDSRTDRVTDSERGCCAEERKGDWTGESPLAHNGGDGDDDGGGRGDDGEKQGEGGADGARYYIRESAAKHRAPCYSSTFRLHIWET